MRVTDEAGQAALETVQGVRAGGQAGDLDAVPTDDTFMSIDQDRVPSGHPRPGLTRS